MGTSVPGDLEGMQETSFLQLTGELGDLHALLEPWISGVVGPQRELTGSVCRSSCWECGAV